MSFLTSRQQISRQGIGKSVRRREDARLLTGAGRYADDINLPGQAYAYLFARRTRMRGSPASMSGRRPAARE